MNEQKDKLLINLVEPGRIGRTAPTTAKTISQFSLRMGIVNCLALLSWMRQRAAPTKSSIKLIDFFWRGQPTNSHFINKVEWNWRVWLGPAEFMKFICFCLSLFERVRGGCGRNAPRRKRKQRQKANEWMNEAERIDLWVEWLVVAESGSLMKSNGADQPRNETAPRGVNEIDGQRNAASGKQLNEIKWI